MANEQTILQEHAGKLVSGFFMLCGSVLVAMSKWLVGLEALRDQHSASHQKPGNERRHVGVDPAGKRQQQIHHVPI